MKINNKRGRGWPIFKKESNFDRWCHRFACLVLTIEVYAIVISDKEFTNKYQLNKS